jgi:glutaminyl-peptide cyclotransferase
VSPGIAVSRRPWLVAGVVVSGLALAGAFFLGTSKRTTSAMPAMSGTLPPATPAPAGRAPERLKVKVRSIHKHDASAYTQGLVWDGDRLWESAGLYGSSSLREVDPASGEVRHKVDVPPKFFAEGLAQVGDRLIQLTWQEGKAFVYRVPSLEKIAEFTYSGEGWGLCYDGKRLVMSDGSDRLTFRDPQTFAPLGEVHVRLSGTPVNRLNELECVDGVVYANVWLEDTIYRIDPRSGEITAVIDASGLLTPEERPQADVLNGIAWNPVKKVFLITGKQWPEMFEAVFVRQ